MTSPAIFNRSPIVLAMVTLLLFGGVFELSARAQNPPRGRGRGAILQGTVVPRSGESTVPQTMVVKLYQLSGPLLQTVLVRNGRFSVPSIFDGQYRLLLEADGYETTDKDLLLQNLVAGQIEFITINLGKPTESTDSSLPQGAPTVGASALSLSPAASKELEKAAKASRKKRYQKALGHLQKVLELHPEYYPAHNNLGVQYLRLERWTEAQSAFRRSIEIHPSAMAYLNLGILLMRQNELTESLELLQQAVEMDPTDDLAVRSLGEALFRAGQYEPALAKFKELSLRHDDPTLNIALANCFVRLDRLEEARQQYRDFLKKEARGDRADFIRRQLKSISP